MPSIEELDGNKRAILKRMELREAALERDIRTATDESGKKYNDKTGREEVVSNSYISEIRENGKKAIKDEFESELKAINANILGESSRETKQIEAEIIRTEKELAAKKAEFSKAEEVLDYKLVQQFHGDGAQNLEKKVDENEVVENLRKEIEVLNKKLETLNGRKGQIANYIKQNYNINVQDIQSSTARETAPKKEPVKGNDEPKKSQTGPTSVESKITEPINGESEITEPQTEPVNGEAGITEPQTEPIKGVSGITKAKGNAYSQGIPVFNTGSNSQQPYVSDIKGNDKGDDQKQQKAKLNMMIKDGWVLIGGQKMSHYQAINDFSKDDFDDVNKLLEDKLDLNIVKAIDKYADISGDDKKEIMDEYEKLVKGEKSNIKLTYDCKHTQYMSKQAINELKEMAYNARKYASVKASILTKLSWRFRDVFGKVFNKAKGIPQHTTQNNNQQPEKKAVKKSIMEKIGLTPAQKNEQEHITVALQKKAEDIALEGVTANDKSDRSQGDTVNKDTSDKSDAER